MTNPMSETEQALADLLYGAIQNASNYSERSQQSASYQIGVSDLGWCSEKVRRMLAGIPEPITDKLKAFIGTALGDHAEQAALTVLPNAIRQAEVTVTLIGDRGTYHLTGHPDLIDPDQNLVIDFKSKFGLEAVRRTGPNLSQQFQRHCYAAGAIEAGLISAEGAKVANVWIDRSGKEECLHVDMEDYDPGVVEHAAQWVDEVVYVYLQDEVAQKEPPREMCEKVCGHFATCRALDTDVSGLLTDPTILAAVEMNREAKALAAKAEKLKSEAASHLAGVNGSTGQYIVRWVHVNESKVDYTRAAYERLDIRPIK